METINPCFANLSEPFFTLFRTYLITDFKICLLIFLKCLYYNRKHAFFYKHLCYKHRQPEIWPKNKHHPSTTPSLTSITAYKFFSSIIHDISSFIIFQVLYSTDILEMISPTLYSMQTKSIFRQKRTHLVTQGLWTNSG